MIVKCIGELPESGTVLIEIDVKHLTVHDGCVHLPDPMIVETVGDDGIVKQLYFRTDVEYGEFDRIVIKALAEGTRIEDPRILDLEPRILVVTNVRP